MSDSDLRVMFIDDDPVTCSVMTRNCESAGYQCQTFQGAEPAFESFKTEGADILVTDLRMPGMNGFDLLREVRALDGEMPVIVITGYSSVENAVEAMKAGATDFIKKPFDFEELKHLIDRTIRSLRLKDENRLLRRRLEQGPDRYGMIGETTVMRRLFDTIEKVSEVSCNVIVMGESGTGKELVARALHEHSPRRSAPFVVIDCGALTETLLESELFGHERGAFTGAAQRKRGLMEQANGGTLFLDEVCNISDAMQVKLMRSIEDQRITRVGGTAAVPTDLRVIAASNRDLEALVQSGQFRHDFYHRLNVVTIRVPPLRERRDDIPALVRAFVAEFAERYNRDVETFDGASLQRLCEAEWSGNVRELRNAVERCVVLADGPTLRWPDSTGAEDGGVRERRMVFPEQDFPSLEEVEQQYINHVLRQVGGKKTRAARLLGIDKTTLWRKLRRYCGEI